MDLSLVVPVLVLIVGCLLAFTVVGRRQPRVVDRIAGSLAWGPGIAAGILSLGSYFSATVKFHQPRSGVFFAITLALVFLATVAASRARGGDSAPLPLNEPRRDSDSQWNVAPGWVALVALAAGYGWTFVRWLDSRPLGSYDAMAIWTYRALQWFRSGEGFPETVGLLVEGKPGYPLLVPGLMVSQFSLWGHESTVIAVATGWFFVLGLGAVTFVAVGQWAASWVAPAAVALILSTPMVWRSTFDQSADLPLAYLTLATAAGLADFVCSSHRPRKSAGEAGRFIAGGMGRTVPPWLTGFFLGLMVWTKNEGMVLALILVAVFAVGAGIHHRGFELRGWIAMAFGSLPGVVATVSFKNLWVATGEIDRYLGPGLVSRLTDPTRWWEVAAAFAEHLTPGSGEVLWGGTWLALAGSLVIGIVRRGSRGCGRAALFYGAAFGLCLGFDIAAYLMTPEPLSWHLRTSLDRLLLQIVPLAVVAVFVCFAREPAVEEGVVGG